MRLSTATFMLALLLGCSTGEPPSPANQQKPDQSGDKETVLNKIIVDVLTNPDLELVRVQYSRKGSKRVALVNNKDFNLLWPPDFKPSILGYDFSFVDESQKRDDNSPPLLGIRLDKFDLNDANVDPFHGNVGVCVLNAGGNKDSPIGGVSIYYVARRSQGGWSVGGLTFEK